VQDSTDAHWDADQQGWVGGTPPESGGGGTPNQLNIPTLVLVPLVVLLLVVAVAVAIGINMGTPTKDSSPSENSSSSEDSASPDDSAGAEGTPDEEEDADSPGSEDQWENQEGETPASDEYEFSTDPDGFELYIPRGWQRELRGPGEGVFYVADDPSHFVQIIDFQNQYASPWGAMQALESELEANSGYDGFGGSWQLVEGAPVMELNYAYDEDVSGRRNVHMRTFRGGDNGVYMVLAAGPANGRELTRERYEMAADSFCVTEYYCP